MTLNFYLVKKTYRYLAALILLFTSSFAFAQNPTEPAFYKPTQPRPGAIRREKIDSLNNPKRPGRAWIEFGMSELTPYVLDRYISQKDYAYISWKTVGYNLNPGHWAWDNDPFQTNQFGHPYHGSYFFRSFRTNGYSFWESVPGPIIGSYLWETFAENQAPAPNDFINTSFGGIVLGEVTYRISNQIVNNKRRGFGRQVSEVAAFIVNPQNGINRILDGKWGKYNRNTVEVDSSKISANLDFGYRKFTADNQSLFGSGGQSGWYFHGQFLYGTPSEHFWKPFTNVMINAEIGKDDSTVLNNISVYGSLTGWQLGHEDKVKHLVVLSANYDYLRNSAFFYGGESVKFNLYSEFQPVDKIKINTTLGGGPILLAAIPTFYPLANGRLYDYGSGVGYNAGGKISFDDSFYISANYRGGWTKTLNGNKSQYLLHVVSGEVCYMPFKQFGAVAESGYYTLQGHYDGVHPNTDRRYPYLKIAARYALNIQ